MGSIIFKGENTATTTILSVDVNGDFIMRTPNVTAEKLLATTNTEGNTTWQSSVELWSDVFMERNDIVLEKTYTTLYQIYLDTKSNVKELRLPYLTSVDSSIQITNNVSLTDVYLPLVSANTVSIMNNTLLSNIDLSSLNTVYTYIKIYGGSLSNINLSGLTTINITTGVSHYHDFRLNVLTESAVDHILTVYDNANVIDITLSRLYLNSNYNAPPSAIGLAAKSSLELKGWFVFVNV